MKFGVREIANVVLKAKAAQKVGKKIFYKNEPVIYFDTLKTSSLEGQSSTVYAQGGRGNPRLVAWEGERTVTFTMEDALISAEGLSILTGAGLIAAGKNASEKTIYQHMTEVIDVSNLDLGENYAKLKEGKVRIPLSYEPYLPDNAGENYAYVMFMKEGEIISEPYIPVHGANAIEQAEIGGTGKSGIFQYWITVQYHDNYVLANSYADKTPGQEGYTEVHKYKANTESSNANRFTIQTASQAKEDGYDVNEMPFIEVTGSGNKKQTILTFDSVLVDYYIARTEGATQIEITADKFGGNYYLEAETLFRNQDGQDLPAEFVIPNCKIQSNFTFTMANSGDPSTFTFTMDAFPDYTRFDHTHKVFAAIQIIEDTLKEDLHRHSTSHEISHNGLEWY